MANISEEQLCAALHSLGSGDARGDIHRTIALAEAAFRGRPYPAALFCAAREAIAHPHGRVNRRALSKIEWILWHDPATPPGGCWTAHIRESIAAMSPANASNWQWLLRHATPASSAAPGKLWVKEGCRRIDPIGEADFIGRVDQWFHFPPEPVPLSNPGSEILRRLVWYGWLVDRDALAGAFARLAGVHWAHREPARSVVSALAGLFRGQPNERYRDPALRLCRDWPDSVREIQLLRKAYDPTHLSRIGPMREDQIGHLERLGALAASFLTRLA